MKIRLHKKLLICLFLVLFFLPTAVNGQNIETGPIKIDGHFITIFQLDELKTFEVNEYLLLNNTGDAVFNDSFYIWIQNNSNIAAKCCNYTSNMACRYNSTADKECFLLDVYNGTNLYFGDPITSENRLSYYGQKETISITAFSITKPTMQNKSIHINATIGGKSIPREKNSIEGNGIYLTTTNQDIGLNPITDTYMPYRIMTIENLTIFNNGTDTEDFGFIVNELQQGWNAEIWKDTVKIENISLSSQESANLNLVITAPSNIASLYVRYTTQIDFNGNDEVDFFIKKYLYDTKLVSFEAYLLSNKGLKVSNDLNMVHDTLFWLEEYERYWFIARGSEVQSNSFTAMSIKSEKTVDNQINPFSIVLLVFIIILIITIIFMRRFGFFKDEDRIEKREEHPDKRINELEEQKKKIFSAIKRVEQEYREEIISKDDYEQLRAAYKKRAVNILKEIDRLKEK